MRTGTVIVCDLGGLGNKIFHSGDKVNERQFPLNNWDQLVKGGFIREDVKELEPVKPAESEAEVVTAAEKPKAEEQTSKRNKRNRR